MKSRELDHACGHSDDELDSSYRSGIAAGWCMAGTMIMEKATEAFKDNDDKKADMLRRLAQECLNKSKS